MKIDRQALGRHRAAHDEAYVELESIDARMRSLDVRMRRVQAKIDKILGKADAVEGAFTEQVGAAWSRATTLFGKGLATIAGELGKGSFEITMTDVERDPTAQKTKAKLSKELPRLREQLAAWAGALEQLAAQREVVAAQMSAHATAMTEALQTITEGRDEALGAVDAAAHQAAHLPGPARMSFFGVMKYLCTPNYDESLGEMVLNVAERLMAETPVPVPVASDDPNAKPLAPDEILTPPKRAPDLPTVDARTLFELPEPKTGRDWLCMVAGLDFGAIRDRRHLTREFDDALKVMKVPIRHQAQPVKDVKRHITRRFGLKERAGPNEVRDEVHRRIVAGVDRFLPADAFEKHVRGLGLEAGASAKQIAAAVVVTDRDAETKELVGAMNSLWGTPRFDEAAGRLDEAKRGLVADLGAPPTPAAVAKVLNEVDVIHGKNGHSTNAVAVALEMLTDPAVSNALDVDAEAILDAIGWLNLGDLETPVGVIAARRKMTDDEFVNWVKPRPQRAADAYRRFGLGSEDAAKLIETHRGRERSTSAIVLDMLDQATALAAKPFFQKDGAPDPDKIAKAVGENAEKARVPEEVSAPILDGIRRGLLATAVKDARPDDQYVRWSG